MRINIIKKQYLPGMRIRLIEMDDCQAPPVGTDGTIMHVDDIGTIHVQWDNGSTLGVCLKVDRIAVIK